MGERRKDFQVKKHPIQSPGIPIVLKNKPARLVQNCIAGSFLEEERISEIQNLKLK